MIKSPPSCIHDGRHACQIASGRDENVMANLRQYGLEHRYVDMLVADAASSVWRQQEVFDAIVTDRN